MKSTIVQHRNPIEEFLMPIETNDKFVLEKSRTTGEFIICYVISPTEDRELFRHKDKALVLHMWKNMNYAFHVGRHGYSYDEISYRDW